MNRTSTKNNGIRALGAMSALLVMLTAAPALAQHNGGPRRDRGHAPHEQFVCGIDGCTDAHRGPGPCFAKREYDRGHSLGYREGKNNGYRDALGCRPFCDSIPRRLKRQSKFFAIGYVDAYPIAYKKSFFEYQTPPRRPRWKRRGGYGGWGNANRGGRGWGRGWGWGWAR